MSFRSSLLAYLSKPLVRPWALSAPVIVLLICLPMLRPLHQPADVSVDEALRLATVESLVRRGTLALEVGPESVTAEAMGGASSSSAMPSVTHLVLDAPGRVVIRQGQTYANQPPAYALLLSGPAWVMDRWLKIPIDQDRAIADYVLTLLTVTLPVAVGAGLLYRMGKLFELPRPARAGLAIATVAGSGLLSYSVVLNPHALAAVMVLCAVSCLIHVSMVKLPKRGVAFVGMAGLCAALAAALDPPAGLIALLLIIVIATLRMPVLFRFAGIGAFLAGAAIPIALHAQWSAPINGEVFPGFKNARLATLACLITGRDVSTHDAVLSGGAAAATAAPHMLAASDPSSPGGSATPAIEPDADEIIASSSSSSRSRWSILSDYASWTLGALVGDHGIFSHFPVMIVGVLGVFAVMHRHWPSFVKTLAAATLVGGMLVIGCYAAALAEWSGAGGAMFASRWFVVFLPLLLFWSGAWLRRGHGKLAWTLAAAAFVFSTTVSLIGMTRPYPKDGYERYTAGEALSRLVRPTSTVVSVRK